MHTKEMEFANAVLDIIFVFLTQILIIFLIIVVPCIFVILKGASISESPNFMLQNLSIESMREMIDQSVLITFIKLIVGPFSVAVAPLTYEYVKSSQKKENRFLLKAYRQGMRIELRGLLFGCLLGFACAGVQIGFTVLSVGTMKYSFAVENSAFSMTVMNLVSICLFCIAQELFIRHYIFLKTAHLTVSGYIILTNLCFLFALCRTMDVLTVQSVLSVLLLSLLMALRYLHTKSISENIGFRSVCEILLFIFFRDTHFVNISSTILLLLLLTYEAISLIKRKGQIVKQNEKL